MIQTILPVKTRMIQTILLAETQSSRMTGTDSPAQRISLAAESSQAAAQAAQADQAAEMEGADLLAGTGRNSLSPTWLQGR